MKAGLIFAVVCVVILPCRLLFAQSQPCTMRTLVTVVDKASTLPVDGLNEKNFQAKFKGHRLPIRSVMPAPAQRRIVFVLDLSASMARLYSFHTNRSLLDIDRSLAMNGLPGGLSPGYPFYHLVNLVLRDAIPAIPKSASVAFQVFAGKHSAHSEFAAPDAAFEKLAELPNWNVVVQGDNLNTALWDNIDTALRMLNPPRLGDVIAVVSDGVDNLSKLQEGSLRKEVLEAGVKVVVIMPRDPDFDLLVRPEDRAAMQDLLDLAKVTGGVAAVIGPPTSTDALPPYRQPTHMASGAREGYSHDEEDAMKLREDLLQMPDPDVALPVHPGELFGLLMHQYEIELEVPVLKKPQSWHLEVAASESARPMYQRYLMPCGGEK